eukprot:CAMPEP_0175646238 /NCGR_PEP_ID=MMETSP0097-20121207/7221_1 /TAXON_ID=311494 /ORGANISM="Alexandrium monilatum, Strain CCMP3105" /LENGTH=163 /DNA_ID=CAMNT_0016952135 /DNA_START=89 /DNA_END=580 /DNA_ORIENTATION=+
MAALSRTATLVLGLALFSGALGIETRGDVAHTSQLTEEAKGFEESGQMLNAEGWRAFLGAASQSARSTRDRSRHADVEQEVEEERSSDISVSDHFASIVEEQSDMPTLRQLAQEHWAGLRVAKSEKPTPVKAGAQKATPRPPTAQGTVNSLRSLLVSAGREGS